MQKLKKVSLRKLLPSFSTSKDSNKTLEHQSREAMLRVSIAGAISRVLFIAVSVPVGLWRQAAIYLGRQLLAGLPFGSDLPESQMCRADTSTLLGLAGGGVYLAGGLTPRRGALLPHLFTLACGPL